MDKGLVRHLAAIEHHLARQRELGVDVVVGIHVRMLSHAQNSKRINGGGYSRVGTSWRRYYLHLLPCICRRAASADFVIDLLRVSAIEQQELLSLIESWYHERLFAVA